MILWRVTTHVSSFQPAPPPLPRPLILAASSSSTRTTSFPYKLPSPWQLPERGHYLGDISDRLRKAGTTPSALYQRTSSFRREHCACVTNMHSVNQLLRKLEGNNLFGLSGIIDIQPASITYCSALLSGFWSSLCFHLVVNQPVVTDTSGSITAASTQISSWY